MTPQHGPLFDSPIQPPARRSSHSAPAPVWLQRMSLIVLVMFCLLIGFELALLPWNERLWDRNVWLLHHPSLLAVLRTGWVRGLVTGLGLLDIWIGVSEAVHYRDLRG